MKTTILAAALLASGLLYASRFKGPPTRLRNGCA